MQKYNIEAYNEEKHKGIVKHIMIRKAFKTNQIMIVIIARNNELPYKKEFINIMVENIEGFSKCYTECK